MILFLLKESSVLHPPPFLQEGPEKFSMLVKRGRLALFEFLMGKWVKTVGGFNFSTIDKISLGLGKKRWGQYFRVGLIPCRTVFVYLFILSIKLVTVNFISYFGVSSVIMLSHRYLLQVVQDELWTLT